MLPAESIHEHIHHKTLPQFQKNQVDTSLPESSQSSIKPHRHYQQCQSNTLLDISKRDIQQLYPQHIQQSSSSDELVSSSSSNNININNNTESPEEGLSDILQSAEQVQYTQHRMPNSSIAYDRGLVFVMPLALLICSFVDLLQSVTIYSLTMDTLLIITGTVGIVGALRGDNKVFQFLMWWSAIMVILDALMIVHAMVGYNEKAKYMIFHFINLTLLVITVGCCYDYCRKAKSFEGRSLLGGEARRTGQQQYGT